MFAAGKTASSGTQPDAQFNYVTMLLHGDGTNGAQNNTFLDSSTNNFTITRNGNTTQGSFSPYGSNWANYFSGVSGNYLSTSPTNSAFDFSSTKTMTFECWFCASALNTDNNLFGINECQPFRFKITTSALVWEANGGTTILSGSQTWVIGTWYHVACVRNTDTLYMFINGTQVATASFSTAWDATGTGYPVSIAANRTDTWFFNGYISNLRLVKGTAVYTSSFTPSTAPLTAISGTSLLTCQSNRFVDNSGNSIALTVNGTPSVQRFSPFANATAYNPATLGGSGYFDGSGDNLSVAANSSNIGTGDFNITFWINLTAAPSNGVPATNAYNAASFTNGWYFYTGVGTDLSFGLGNATGAAAVTATVNLINEWHFIEVTRSGSTLSIYVDGVFATSKTNTNNGSVSGNVTRIGARYDGTSGYIQGYITDFKVVVGTAGNTSNYTPPTAPVSATGSTLLLSMQNAAIFDNAMMNDLETVGNAQISTSVVKYGTGSLAFDGSGDWLIMPYGPTQNFGTGAFTIEGWFYLNSLAASYYVPAGTWGSGTSDEWLIQIQNNGSIRFLTTAGSTFYSASITTATWYHIAVVRSGSTVTIYVNGTSVGSYTCTNSLGSTAKTLYIGTQAGSWDWNGYIDDFRITNGYARYTSNFTPPTAAFPNIGPV